MGQQHVGGGPWSLWCIEVGLIAVGHKAGGRMGLGLHLTCRVTTCPGVSATQRFPRSKTGKVLGNWNKFVTQPGTLLIHYNIRTFLIHSCLDLGQCGWREEIKIFKRI